MLIRFANSGAFRWLIGPVGGATVMSWAPPAIVPIPSNLGVHLTSVLPLLHVARTASGARKSPSFDGFWSSQTLPFHGFRE
jgi:hypothetical protein